MLAIAAIIVCIWFYKAALSNRYKSPWIWAAVGVSSYYVTGTIWVYLILKPIMGFSYYHLSPIEGVFLELSGIAVAVLVVFFIKKTFMHQMPANENLPLTDS